MVRDPSSGKAEAPLVFTFRSHHNAYSEDDESGATIIRHSRPQSKLYSVCQILFCMVMIHYFFWIVPMAIALWLPYHFGYTNICILMLGVYVISYMSKDELKRGRPWNWLRQHPWFEMLLHYGQVEIVREAELDRKRKYIFGYHPHGILILSRVSTYAGIFEKLFPGIEQRCLGATPMFQVPGSREMCLWMGAVRADRSNAVQILSKHKMNLLLYPGGSEEIFLTEPDSLQTTIIARKGFIRLALQNGCDLVPCFAFGERHAYKKLEISQAIKSFFMKKLRMPLIIFWGRFFTWLPFKQNGDQQFFLSVVYGKPIRVERALENPTEEQVDALYEEFYGQVRGLYSKYKGKYGYAEHETLLIREYDNKRGRSTGLTKRQSIGSA